MSGIICIFRMEKLFYFCCHNQIFRDKISVSSGIHRKNYLQLKQHLSAIMLERRPRALMAALQFSSVFCSKMQMLWLKLD